MPLDKSKLFSIGDVAGLFNLSTGTLRHYETLGLITPEYTDPDTGYRYYSVRQFEPLNTVRYLCMLNMPLGSIGDFLQNRDVDVIEQKLRRQKEEILEKQRELAVIERKINSRLRMISDARSSPLDVIEVKMLPPCRLVWVEKPLSIDDSLDMELPIRRLDSAQDTAVFLGKVGVGISRDNLLGERFDKYDCIFLILDEDEDFEGAKCLPEAKCVSLRYCGSHREAATQYKTLSRYMRENELSPAGFSREVTMIDFGITCDPEKFVTEISIPIENK